MSNKPRRPPLLCVNGDLNFGVTINAETGMPEGGRGCICAARTGDTCICDLGVNGSTETRERLRVLEEATKRGDFVKIESGYYVYWPTVDILPALKGGDS